MQSRLKIIFVFVDGLGIGSQDPAVNLLRNDRFPLLSAMQQEAVALDACLGVEGLPQSATGQTTLLTGTNAAQCMGRHIEGFPPSALKTLIEQNNLFSNLLEHDRKPIFANCYWNVEPTQIPLRRRSVTTVMTLATLGRVLGNADLLDGRSVTHDITRETMHLRGYDGAIITPETAADHLMALAEHHDFTLFEHFLTDHAGHSGQREKILLRLNLLDRFLQALTAFTEQPGRLLILCSDHGNIEDFSTRTHTRNPVPLWAKGAKAEHFSNLRHLYEVSPAILSLMQQTDECDHEPLSMN